ncbi:BTAD domain-containing putative transcriptional regulator [Streptomyces sp. AC512_CC834]|uniref:AfsR/SARP family transcriptional regulator n=1 Tax=Streptomyces sp. AC512_CC834 TaxID=2823691 RepID=UPI0027E4EDA4|nr:BTAD domain-containing putative transcriptional regulator [Streptomyces sp. AC512_CC834]
MNVAEQLTVHAPLREVSWSLLMRALYAAGRPVEALRQYDRLRAMPARELGLDPSPGCGTCTSPSCGTTPAPSGFPGRHGRPQHWPPPVAGAPLVGRGKEMAQLGALLRDAAVGHARWAVVSGEPGPVKTRLLDEFAAQATEAGSTVARAGGGHALGGSGTAPARPGPARAQSRGKDPARTYSARSSGRSPACPPSV